LLKNFLTTLDLTSDQLNQLIDSALRFKNGADKSKPLAGKSVALVFFNPSLRTRASMQVGIHELGGHAVVLEPGGTSWTLEHRAGAVMDGDKTEHVAEFVRVLSRYCAGIGVRTFAALKNWDEERTDPILNSFAQYSEVPIINLESAMHHPCQSLADMMTIQERLGQARKRVVLAWAWHPKPLPMAVPNSFALAAAHELMKTVEEQSAGAGGTIEITNDIEAAFERAEVIYAKSWGAKHFYGTPEKDVAERARYREKWIVDEQKMARTNRGVFMHCLPVRRNVIVTDSVIDSPASVVIDEAENRLHVQKAIMTRVLSAEY
jgi:N-acetylornithine carbamoyltransferase